MAASADSVVPIADVRLIQRLRSGEPAAFQQLWGAWRDAAWAACHAMAESRDASVALLTVVYRDLPRAVRAWDRQTPVCCRMAAHVFSTLARELELPSLAGIETGIPRTVRAPDPSEIRARLAELDPTVRLVYIADLFFGCSSGTLAALVDVDEEALRAARAAAAYALVAEGGA